MFKEGQVNDRATLRGHFAKSADLHVAPGGIDGPEPLSPRDGSTFPVDAAYIHLVDRFK